MTKTQPQPDGDFAYWLFTPAGVLMPAALPPDIAARYPPGTLQVRARDAAHLDHFRKRWCPELGPVVKTPTLDYDCRAYVSAESLALAVARMTLAISASKFKPTTGGPEGLKSKAKAARLHSVYNAVWGRVLELSPQAKSSESWSGGNLAMMLSRTPLPARSRTRRTTRRGSPA